MSFQQLLGSAIQKKSHHAASGQSSGHVDENQAKRPKTESSCTQQFSRIALATERLEQGGFEQDKSIEIINPATTKLGDFAVIGQKYGTDKVTHHGYHRFYPRYLEFYRSTILRNENNVAETSNSNDNSESASTSVIEKKGYGMLEIGIDESASLKTWLEYFPAPTFIYGLDINDKENPRGDRYHILKGDQTQRNRLWTMIEQDIRHHIFFIIDDGSHVPDHQIKTFNLLFSKLLLPGGTYIIEDLETSYWSHGGLYGYSTNFGYRHQKSAIEALKMLVDDINREYLTTVAREEHDNTMVGKFIDFETRSKISSITFGQNCAIILKKTEEEMKLYNNRQYRFEKNL